MIVSFVGCLILEGDVKEVYMGWVIQASNIQFPLVYLCEAINLFT